MHGLDTIRYLNDERAKRRGELEREPIKLRPDNDSIRNSVQRDSEWECNIETECYVNDGNWLSSLTRHLSEATPEQRAWLEEVALETALLPLLAASGYTASTTRLDITFVRGDQRRENSWKNWATWKVRLSKKAPTENKHPSTQHMAIDYASGVLQPHFHDLHARMLIKQLTEDCGRAILTEGVVRVYTLPKSTWLLFTQDEQKKILRSLGLEYASLTDLVAAFFYDPTIDANVYRSRTKEPHKYKEDTTAHNFDNGMDFTAYRIEWNGKGVPKISKCAATLGSIAGLQGGRNLLLREKTRI